MQKTAAMKRAGAVMGVTIAVLCVLLVAFSYYHATRATISPYGELSLWDTIVMNSDIIMGLVFLAACSVPFFLKFERRKPRGRRSVKNTLRVISSTSLPANMASMSSTVMEYLPTQIEVTAATNIAAVTAANNAGTRPFFADFPFTF